MSGAISINPAAVVPRNIPDEPKRFRVLDAVVILIFLFLVFWFIRLFYLNLFQTLDSNLDPIGHVTMRINNIQRRQGDRVLWDRVKNESPVYSGDIIRVAEQSGVALHFDNNSVELDENTMIRIQKFQDGQTRIELASGTLRLDTGEDGGNISLVVAGKTIEAQAGTVLSVVSSDDEIVLNVLSVTEGYAVLIDEYGDPYEAETGTVISFNGGRIEVDASNVIKIEELETEEIAEIDSGYSAGTDQLASALSLLPAPVLLQPVSGYNLGPSELRTLRNIEFNWRTVNEANAYILSLYHQTANGRRLISRTNPLARTNWTLSDFSILNHGNFVWQVEAVYRDENGIIQRRGYMAERQFTVDIPVPEVELHETRNLYDQ